MTVEKPLFIRICKLSYVALHCRKNYIAGTTVYTFHYVNILCPSGSVFRPNGMSLTSPAGGLSIPLQGHVAFPSEGGLTNLVHLVTGGRLKAAFFNTYFLYSPSRRSFSYCSSIYRFIVASFTLPIVSQ